MEEKDVMESQSSRDLLVRMDERMRSMATDINKIYTKLEKDYVLRSEFRPVMLITYGFISAGSIGVITWVLIQIFPR